MGRWRKIIWACGFLGVAAAALVVAEWRRRPQLPPLASYPSLPAAFGRALRDARAKAESAGDPGDIRELAHLYQANRLFPEAKACYRVLASGRPGLAARDHYLLAAMALDESDLGGAASELRAAIQGEPGYAPAHLALADALFKAGQSEDAAKEYAAVLAIEPEQPQASVGVARCDLQRGDDGAAVALLQELLRHHPETTSGSALLAQVMDRRGDADSAAALREQSQQTHEPVPPDPWLDPMLLDCYDLQRLGIAFEQYRLTGQMDEALPLLGRLEELDPHGWIPPMLHGWSQRSAGHYAEAARDYREALGKGGDPERICPLLVNALLKEGAAGEAAALLADYHSRFPDSMPILLSYCEVAVWRKDTALARRLLGDALKRDPYLYMPNMSMVQILWTSGEHDAAAACLQRVARVFPSDIDSRGLLGQYYMERSDPASAIRVLEQGVSLASKDDPRRARLTKMLDTAYLSAGGMDASAGDYPKALAMSAKSIELVPDGMRGYALRANVCARTGDYKAAAQALGKMCALDPVQPRLQLGLGDALFLGGDAGAAREHWERALALASAGPGDLRAAIDQRLIGNLSPDEIRRQFP